MIDTDFEAAGRLLTPSGYFDRVRELCKEGSSVKDAWTRVESELPFGLRRFLTYTSFEHERKREADGVLRKPQFRVE